MIVTRTRLQAVEVMITPAERHQLVVGPALNHAPGLDEQDFVGVHQRAQTMRDDHRRAFILAFAQGHADAAFRRRVDRRARRRDPDIHRG